MLSIRTGQHTGHPRPVLSPQPGSDRMNDVSHPRDTGSPLSVVIPKTGETRDLHGICSERIAFADADGNGFPGIGGSCNRSRQASTCQLRQYLKKHANKLLRLRPCNKGRCLVMVSVRTRQHTGSPHQASFSRRASRQRVRRATCPRYVQGSKVTWTNGIDKENSTVKFILPVALPTEVKHSRIE